MTLEESRDDMKKWCYSTETVCIGMKSWEWKMIALEWSCNGMKSWEMELEWNYIGMKLHWNENLGMELEWNCIGRSW